ncbi:MAG: isocitrate lyase/PEP mutase family protein [Pseudomonadota bacterium]
MSLRERLRQPQILVAPGCYDALSALLAQEAGAEAVYLSGASISYTRLGRSDIGLATMSEVVSTLELICDRIDVPVIVDGDNGFGNALNVQRTVRYYERAGASAIQLEDQAYPKRCGHLTGKTLIPGAEMVGKIQAALDARTSDDTLIIARTDAIAVEGFEPAMERAESYAAAGADVLFVEAPRTPEEMMQVTQAFAGRVPLLANMVEGGKTPLKPADELEEMGYSLVIFPGGLVRAQIRATRNYFSSLLEHGSTNQMLDEMADLTEVNATIGTDELLDLGRKYGAGEDPE